MRRSLRNLSPGHRPDFLIVGAQKAGTTSLYAYLRQHPTIVGAVPKEVHFFDLEENYEKGAAWYESAFRAGFSLFGKRLFFEATPSYLYHKQAAERIFQYRPDLKIIVLLREPAERAYSSWNMYRDFRESEKNAPALIAKSYVQGQENNLQQELFAAESFPTFAEAVESELKKMRETAPPEEPSFVRRGIYVQQIKRFAELFGREKILVLGFRDLTGDNKKATLNRILEFIGLPPADWSFLREEKKNVRQYPAPMDAETRACLDAFYAPYNEQLFDYLQFKPNW